MASIIKRKNSFFISVSCGYDQNGRQIRRTMTYKPEPSMTEKQIQKEVQRQAVLFEEQVRNGQVSSDGRLKLADFVPMYPTTPTQWFAKFLKRNGLPHRKFHALRHTSATLLLSNGTNIKNVATRLGHTQLKTTNRYVHAVEQVERQAANTLELILGGRRKTG